MAALLPDRLPGIVGALVAGVERPLPANAFAAQGAVVPPGLTGQVSAGPGGYYLTWVLAGQSNITAGASDAGMPQRIPVDGRIVSLSIYALTAPQGTTGIQLYLNRLVRNGANSFASVVQFTLPAGYYRTVGGWSYATSPVNVQAGDVYDWQVVTVGSTTPGAYVGAAISVAVQ